MERPIVLISDDEPLVVSALARVAKREGLEPVGVARAEELHETAARLQPSVIILDVRQPIDGRDLLSALKADPRTRDITVVVLSAVEDQFVRHTCFELGARDYDVKPFDDGFMRKVLRLLAESGRTSGA